MRGGGIALVFARTETEAFYQHVWLKATALYFIKGRLNFHHVTGKIGSASAPAPSVLIAYGETAVTRMQAAIPLLPLGKFIRL